MKMWIEDKEGLAYWKDNVEYAEISTYSNITNQRTKRTSLLIYYTYGGFDEILLKDIKKAELVNTKTNRTVFAYKK